MRGPDTESLAKSLDDLVLSEAAAGEPGHPPAQLQLVPAVRQRVRVPINKLELEGLRFLNKREFSKNGSGCC